MSQGYIWVTFLVFVRKKKNKSGIISVQIIDKSTGKYRMLKTIGSSSAPAEIERLVDKGKLWIKEHTQAQEFDFNDYNKHIQHVLDGIEQISVCGPELLLGAVFDQIGFGQITDPLFRTLVLARLCFPASKLKTTELLSRHQFIKVDVQTVYRYLDKLYNHQKGTVQQISYEHTKKILGGRISVVFYDVTTLYFETDEQDELRRTGFSKDGKHQHPQIVLGLLVSRGGYPLAYDIFEGNRFEGGTMLPVINEFKKSMGLISWW